MNTKQSFLCCLLFIILVVGIKTFQDKKIAENQNSFFFKKHTKRNYQFYELQHEQIHNSLSQTEIQDLLLSTHNELRNKVASGQQKGQPSASNMRKLEWNQQLQLDAQQCSEAFQQSGGEYYGLLGENLAYMTQSKFTKENIQMLVEAWYNEVKDFNENEVKDFKSSDTAGNYSQLVWAKTSRVGCGITQNKDDIYLCCKYDPIGNWENKSIYEIGQACSDCPEGSFCDKEYTALCNVKGIIEKNHIDNYKDPNSCLDEYTVVNEGDISFCCNQEYQCCPLHAYLIEDKQTEQYSCQCLEGFSPDDGDCK